MSSPFPLEERSASDNLYSGPMSDPWHGPAKPGFFTGLLPSENNAYLGPSYPILAGAGSGAAKAERAVGDLLHSDEAFNYATDESGSLIATDAGPQGENEGLNPLANAIQADAKMRVQALTPDANTTGTAVQVIHGLSEGVYLATVGGAAGGVPGAAALMGGVEGSGAYHELKEQGVDQATALKSASVTAAASAAGVLIPGGFGSTLARKILTGASSQVGLGFASRYADHTILEANGYPEMAAQQKIWDGTQILTDVILGTAFGGMAHLHGREAGAIKAAANEPGVVDAALVANLAAHDRNLAPGVPVDPAATHAHQDALEVSNEQLLQGKPNDISQTGVDQAKFAQRQVDDEHLAVAQAIAAENVPELQRRTEVHSSILETLSQQREQLVSESADFMRGNEARGAERELAQHEADRREAQEEYEAIPETKEAAELKPEILARMEADDRESLGDAWDSKQYTKLREKAATKEAREAADVNKQVYMQRKADAQGAVDTIDERIARQRSEVTRLNRAEESFKALKSHDAAVGKAGNDSAKLIDVIRDEEDRLALKDQLEPMAPTEENLARHVAENPDAAISGYLNTETGLVHLDDLKETAPLRLSERNLAKGDDEGARANAGTAADTARRAAAGEPKPISDAGRGGGTAAGTAGSAAESAAGRNAGESRLGETVEAALQERPDLQVTNDEGKPMAAADLMRQVQEEAARETSDFQKAVNAAITCFGRRGA